MTRFPSSRVWALAILAGAAGCDRPPAPGIPFGHLLEPPVGRFSQISSSDTAGGNLDRLEIAAGDSAVLLDLAGPGVIQRIWLTVLSRDPHYLRRIALKMYWDGETMPSVAVPLGDFFGNGFEKRHYTALPMGVSSGGFYCYLPLPFRRHARIVVENGSGRAIDAFYYNIGLLHVDRLPSDVATFHAAWHRDPRTEDTTAHLVLAAKGAGRFVGLVFNAESYRNNLEFLEGDERFYVDGELRGQGTGTEDYFNAGWYFDAGPFAAAYHGLVLKDEVRGRIAAYRWHVPDPVPFRDSIRVEIEHGHANTEVADYATVAYWYQSEPHAPLPPLPPPDARRVLGVKIPVGAFLREALEATPSGQVTLIAAPVPRPDRYEAVVYPMGGPERGTATFALPGREPRVVDLEHPEPETVLAPISLGVVAAAERVTIELRGDATLPAALELRPVRVWATQWHVVGPFPNPQTLGTDRSAALDSVYPPERDPSLGARYTGMTGTVVGWKRVTASPDGQVRLNPHFTPNDWATAYAQTFLYSPDGRVVSLLLGADDAHVLWVNGERVSERQGRHISRPDDIEIPVRLRRGWNRVLLKVADLDGGWAFQLRAADPDAAMRWSASPATPRRRTSPG